MNSQNDEEARILSYFGPFVGTFLDIGANDGITLSNTHELVKRGWKGALVEPSPKAVERLFTNYFERIQKGQLDLHRYAIGPAEGIATLQESGEHLKVGDVALLSTLIESEADKWKPEGNTFEPTDVKVHTFATFLELSQFKTFDFISIDAEGLDMSILEQMDLHALGCRMLIIEHEHLDAPEMIRYCRRAGLRLIHKNRQNLILVK